ncbi:pre-toxin TG domain-containing protein [Priestia megaterium]|uniref:pre-toxin TG domain-containing protein n=1 Tax=Priestia megaterium TaxID=1404 RepID=UPI003D03C34E
MKKIFSIILIVFLLSFCNLPNYIQNNKAEAATYEFTGDFQKDVETLKKLVEDYKKLDSSSSSSITIKIKKAEMLAKITAKVKEIKDEYTELANSVNSAVNQVVKTFKTIDQALTNSIVIVNDMNKTVDEMNQTLNEMVKIQNEMIKTQNGMIETQNELIKQQKDIVSCLDEMNRAMADANHALDTMNSGIKQVNSSLDGANKAMVQMNKDLQDTNKSLYQMVGGIDKANDGMKTMVSSVNKANTAINNANKAMDTMNKSVDTVNSYFTKVDKSLDKVNSVAYPNKQKININEEMSKIAKGLNAINKIQSENVVDTKVVTHIEDLNKDLEKVLGASSLLADFLPIIANIKGLNDSYTGTDLITRKDVSSLDRTISGLSILGGGMVKAVSTTGKTLNTASKLGSKMDTKYAQTIAWSMPKGGAVIHDRKYTEHALERMAPNTAEVRAELTTRAHQKAAEKGIKVGTTEYNKFIKSYVDPRGITPTVIEDAIKNTPAKPGSRAGTFDHMAEKVKVVVNNNGDVITVIPR